MGQVNGLFCPKCGTRETSQRAFKCVGCGSILEVHVEISHLSKMDFAAMRASPDRSIWRWFDFFPISERSSIVSLGEGSTPLMYAVTSMLTMSPSSMTVESGMPWQMISFSDVQQDLGQPL